jgi:hypothetical protein
LKCEPARDAERHRLQTWRHRVLANDAEIEPAIGELLHDFIRAEIRRREMYAREFIDDFSEPWNHEPLNQAVAGSDGESNALLLALGTEVIERTQLFSRQFRQAFALCGEFQDFSAALRNLAAEELRKALKTERTTT